MKRTVRIKIFPPTLHFWHVSVNGFLVAFPVKTHGLFHTTPEEFENVFFTLKTRQMLPSTTPEEFTNATITGQFGFVFEGNSDRENHMIISTPSFRKAPFSAKCFPSTLKRKAGVFKFLHFEERFRILVPFS